MRTVEPHFTQWRDVIVLQRKIPEKPCLFRDFSLTSEEGQKAVTAVTAFSI
jgi:hypothetical protein